MQFNFITWPLPSEALAASAHTALLGARVRACVSCACVVEQVGYKFSNLFAFSIESFCSPSGGSRVMRGARNRPLDRNKYASAHSFWMCGWPSAPVERGQGSSKGTGASEEYGYGRGKDNDGFGESRESQLPATQMNGIVWDQGKNRRNGQRAL